MASGTTTIDRDTMLLLMRFADGELEEGEELARATGLVEDDAACADFVSQLLVLSSVTEAAALARVPEGFDVAGAVMERVEKAGEEPGAPEEQRPAVATSNVRSLDDRRRRFALVAILAVAAAAILYARMTRDPEIARTPVETPTVAPQERDDAKDKPELARADQGGVDVNSVESPQHVSVFVLPESNASASSVVVWIDDPSGGE